MVAAIMEMLQKSPLHFSAVRNANVFEPISMIILEPVELRGNMRKLLTHVSTTLALSQ